MKDGAAKATEPTEPGGVTGVPTDAAAAAPLLGDSARVRSWATFASLSAAREAWTGKYAGGTVGHPPARPPALTAACRQATASCSRVETPCSRSLSRRWARGGLLAVKGRARGSNTLPNTRE
jgi:hypothetical protein